MKYLFIATSGCVAIALIGTVAADWIAALLFPSDALLLANIIRVTIWALPLVAIEMVLCYGLNAAGKDAVLARASLPSAIISLSVSVCLVLAFGLVGACWSMLLRPAIRVAILAPMVQRTFTTKSEGSEPSDPMKLEAVPEAAAYRKAG